VVARGPVPAPDPVEAGGGQALIIRHRLATLAVAERAPALDRVAVAGLEEAAPTSAAALAAADRTSATGLVAADRISVGGQASAAGLELVAVLEVVAGQAVVQAFRLCLPRGRILAAVLEWAAVLKWAAVLELVVGQAEAQGPCLPRDRTSGLAAADQGPAVSAADQVSRPCQRWGLGLPAPRSVLASPTVWAIARRPACRAWATEDREPASSPPIPRSGIGATH
jgi:hypothetical protein